MNAHLDETNAPEKISIYLSSKDLKDANTDSRAVSERLLRVVRNQVSSRGGAAFAELDLASNAQWAGAKTVMATLVSDLTARLNTGGDTSWTVEVSHLDGPQAQPISDEMSDYLASMAELWPSVVGVASNALEREISDEDAADWGVERILAGDRRGDVYRQVLGYKIGAWLIEVLNFEWTACRDAHGVELALYMAIDPNNPQVTNAFIHQFSMVDKRLDGNQSFSPSRLVDQTIKHFAG